MPSPAKRPGKTEFSIDDFIGEIEKAEAETANKRLPQERLKNKRALDQAARREGEKESTRRAAEQEARGFGPDAPSRDADSIVPGKAQPSHRSAA